MFNCNTHLLYYTVEYESSLLRTGPSWSWDHEWRATLGPRTRSDLSPEILGNSDTGPSSMMYVSNGKCEIEAMVCYSYSIALMVLIAQMQYTSTLPWDIRYVWSLRVPPGPGTTSDGSLLVLGPGVTHHPWSYGQMGTLPSGMMYISNKEWKWKHYYYL